MNYPLTTGDHLWTDADARAEITIGSSAIRLAPQSAFGFLAVDDRTTQVRLSQGAVAVLLRHLGDDEAFEIDTPNGAVSLLRPGSYRVDVDSTGDTTTVTVRHGEAEVTASGSAFSVHADDAAVVVGSDSPSYDIHAALRPDDLDDWCTARDRRWDEARSARYVSRDVIGYEDLDDYGDWRETGPYGAVWVPRTAVVGWAPYRYGHWTWVDPWGWTWIDDAPWGFAPFHYGRWVYVEGGWAWVPGRVVARPVYAPALVAFVGGRNWSVAIGLGGGGGGGGVGRPASVAVRRPPEAVTRRTVVVRTPPPPPLVPFTAREPALRAHPGRPLDDSALASLRARTPAARAAPLLRPAVPVTSEHPPRALRPAREGLPVTRPVSPSAAAPRPEQGPPAARDAERPAPVAPAERPGRAERPAPAAARGERAPAAAPAERPGRAERPAPAAAPGERAPAAAPAERPRRAERPGPAAAPAERPAPAAPPSERPGREERPAPSAAPAPQPRRPDRAAPAERAAPAPAPARAEPERPQPERRPAAERQRGKDRKAERDSTKEKPPN